MCRNQQKSTCPYCVHVTLAAVIAACSGTAEAADRDDASRALNVRRAKATGVARFVTAADRGVIPVSPAPGKRMPEPLDFFRTHGRLFGVTDPDRQLVVAGARADVVGRMHTTIRQVYEGVPVFAGVLRVHADARGQVVAANGTFIPDIKISTKPVLGAEEAAGIAVAEVTGQLDAPIELTAVNKELYVFRANLARGIPGPNHLVYEVEVVGGPNVREFVYVDAHKGQVVDQITGIHEALQRIVYDGDYSVVIWEEGDAYPTLIPDVDHIIDYSEDTYNLIASMTNGTFLSWDGADGIVYSVNNASWLNCPNASWSGFSTDFCPGMTGDDTVGHEISHAYTDSTHNLIYQYQPGALNEAYADIYGEVVDNINGAGTDTPAPLRTVGECSTFGGNPLPECRINFPPAIAGPLHCAGATFYRGPPVSVTADVELINDGDDEDGAGTATDGCQTLIDFTPGRIALIDRGRCNLIQKVQIADFYGAVGVMIVNNKPEGIIWMGGEGTSGIPAVMISLSDGDAIKGALPGANATITLPAATEASLRWLQGEDNEDLEGPVRDMWHPPCMLHPGKVTDELHYYCGSGDHGGVHINSGVPNHGFALLVDGGVYNGQTITGIGQTKAFHIYWQAQYAYQVPVSDFADHADALEQSCQDLIGVNLYALSTETPTGTPSGASISAADCGEVADMIAAVELRTEPTRCNYAPLLVPNPPPLCKEYSVVETISLQDWEGGLGSWTVGTRDEADPLTFDTPDWAVEGDLPGGRTGSAAFVADLAIGDCGADTEAGVLYLESPVIVIPPGSATPRIAVDHWVATEANWDGSNVKFSVNGGSWQLIPGSAFEFNTYNSTLNTSDNPMGSEKAFTGSDGGSVEGSWGQSQINLSGIAQAGDNIRLRFEMGLDGCNGVVGWYVDEVQVYSCTDTTACKPSSPPETEKPKSPSNRFLSIKAGDPKQIQAIRVRFVSLPSPFNVWNGMDFWVGQPREACENSGKGLETDPVDCPASLPTVRFWAAPLVCEKAEAHYMDWHGKCVVGTCVGGLKPGKACLVDDDCQVIVSLYNEGIVPSDFEKGSAIYDIQVIDEQCPSESEEAYSIPLTMIQPRWGDVCGPGGGGACTGQADGIVDVTNDVLGVLDKFANVNNLQKVRADLEPNDDGINNGPDFKVNVANDVLYVLDAFTGRQYPASPKDPCAPGLAEGGE